MAYGNAVYARPPHLFEGSSELKRRPGVRRAACGLEEGGQKAGRRVTAKRNMQALDCYTALPYKGRMLIFFIGPKSDFFIGSGEWFVCWVEDLAGPREESYLWPLNETLASKC